MSSKWITNSLICGIAIGCLSACSALEPRPPLTVQDGQFYKGGQPFKGVGVNFYTVLQRKLGIEGNPSNLSDTSYRQGLETLARHDIPFIRFGANGFYPNDWDVYLNHKEEYFKAFDALVADAERLEIGLVPSLFWYFPTVPDLVGESIDQWGNPDSKTHAFMRQYTTEVVSRYKDSPAIWAWEFGNEWIHEADLPELADGRGWTEPEPVPGEDPAPPLGLPKTRTIKDKMYRKNIYVAYQAFVDTIRAIDPLRPIFSGDATPRPGAWHTYHNGQWGTDSLEQWEEMFLQDNAAMDGLSSHFYYFSLDDKHHDVGYMEYGPAEQMTFMMEISTRAKKPLFVGEYGPGTKDKTLDEERRQFEFLLDLMVKNEVPLSALWNFDFEHVDQGKWNVTEDNHRAYMLDALQEANRKLMEQ
jgi:hypothetical protein